MRSSNDVNVLKSTLKTHYLSIAYNQVINFSNLNSFTFLSSCIIAFVFTVLTFLLYHLFYCTAPCGAIEINKHLHLRML